MSDWAFAEQFPGEMSHRDMTDIAKRFNDEDKASRYLLLMMSYHRNITFLYRRIKPESQRAKQSPRRRVKH